MEFEAGAIIKGKVTGIAKFGAFVELAPGKSGLVYISEISNAFVKDVSDYLTVGQEVTVKILNIDSNGRINLSIKQAAAQPPREKPQYEKPAAEKPFREKVEPKSPIQSMFDDEPPADPSFEDKLKKFMKDSDSRMSDIRRQSERKSGGRRGR